MATIKKTSYLKTGDTIHRHDPFLWYKPSRYVSALIRFVTKSWSGHTAIVIHYFGLVMVAESDNGKIQVMPFDTWAKDAEIVVGRINISNRKRRKIASIAIEQLGKTYDLASTQMYCSKFVAYCYNKVLSLYPNWYKTAPQALYGDTRFKWIYKGKAKDLIK